MLEKCLMRLAPRTKITSAHRQQSKLKQAFPAREYLMDQERPIAELTSPKRDCPYVHGPPLFKRKMETSRSLDRKLNLQQLFSSDSPCKPLIFA